MGKSIPSAETGTGWRPVKSFSNQKFGAPMWSSSKISFPTENPTLPLSITLLSFSSSPDAAWSTPCACWFLRLSVTTRKSRKASERFTTTSAPSPNPGMDLPDLSSLTEPRYAPDSTETACARRAILSPIMGSFTSDLNPERLSYPATASFVVDVLVPAK